MTEGIDPSAMHTLGTRRSVPPALLATPAPTDRQLDKILTLASRVPDHGALVPWRFIIVPQDKADKLLQAYIHMHAKEEPSPEIRSTMASRLKAWLIGPPLIVFLIYRPHPEANFPEADQYLTAGAVATSLLHAVHASGFGSIWLTGWACFSQAGKTIFGLSPDEKIIGLFPIGTPSKRPAERKRPDIAQLISTWNA